MKFIKKLSKKYSLQVLQSIITTTYAKKNISILFIILTTSIIKLHITFLLSLVFTINPYVDYFSQIAFSVIVHFQSYRIYNYLTTYNYRFYLLTRYLINNYTEENGKRWKKITVLGISAYLILILYFTEITSFLLIIYIIQYLIIFFIIDCIEENKFVKAINWCYQKYYNNPKIILIDKIRIIDDYYKVEKSPPTEFVVLGDFEKEIKKNI